MSGFMLFFKFIHVYCTLLRSLCIICSLINMGQVKLSMDEYFMAIYLFWASINFNYFHTTECKIIQGFPFKKIFRGHCDPQVVDFGGHFQFERVTY